MEKKEYLNEENYQKTKGKISAIAFIVLVVGLIIGGMLIVKGIQVTNDVNSSYSDTSKASLTEKLQQEESLLKSKKLALESKGIKYSSFASYSDGEAYDLKLITNVMDPSFNYWKFDEYKNNSITKNYCLLKEQIEDVSSDFNKNWELSSSIPYYMFGGIIIIVSCIIAGSIYRVTKRREIAAFSAQQMRPIVEEEMEKMAPSMGNVAKEITKGIKEGLDNDQN